MPPALVAATVAAAILLLLLPPPAATKAPPPVQLPQWANSSAGVHKFLVWDDAGFEVSAANASFYATQIERLASQYDFIWGANLAHVKQWRQANPAMVVSAYRPLRRDYEDCTHDRTPAGARREIAWWQAHHPTWITYQCDRTTPAYEYSDPTCVPLDISNPEVIQYQLENCTAPAARAGYNAIAVDNMGFGAGLACGVFDKHGKWVQLYNGTDAEPSLRSFARDVIKWTQAMAVGVHAQGMLLIPNWSTYGESYDGSFNASDGFEENVGWNDSLAFALTNASDGILSEAGWASVHDSCGRKPPYDNLSVCEWSESAWENNLNWVRNLQRHGKAFYPIDYWNSISASAYKNVSRVAVEWLVGSYLMSKGDASAMNIPWPEDTIPRNLSIALSWPEYRAPLGVPTEPPTKTGSTEKTAGGDDSAVWRRRFEHGVVFVKPNNRPRTRVALDRAYCTARGEHLPAGTAALELGAFGVAILLDECGGEHDDDDDAAAATLRGGGSPCAGELLHNGICLPVDFPPKDGANLSDTSVRAPPYVRHPPDVINISTGRQLLAVDDFLIASPGELQRRWHTVQYDDDANPVLTPTKEWEGNIAMPFSSGAWFDEEAGASSSHAYKLFYNCGASKNMTCLAVSHDAKTWRKPLLAAATRKDTNIVREIVHYDSNVIWLDHGERNSSRRWKMSEAACAYCDHSFGLLASADGITWEVLVQRTGYVPDRSTIFYDPFRSKWVFSIKSAKSHKGQGRCRAYWESTDLFDAHQSNWTHDPLWKTDCLVSKSGRVESCGQGIPRPWVGTDQGEAYLAPPLTKTVSSFKPQLYNLDAVGYESLMVGAFNILQCKYSDDPTHCPGGGQGGHASNSTEFNSVFVGFSRDGWHWSRTDVPRRPLAGLSPDPNSWNFEDVQSTGGGFLVQDDILRFFFSGRRVGMKLDTTGTGTLRRGVTSHHALTVPRRTL
jgi:hypothetical protein